MAAYAALVSLMHTIDDIKRYPYPLIPPDKQQLQSLTENATFLQEFLEGYDSPFGDRDEPDPLELRIADATYAAEHVIESYVIHLPAPTTHDDDDDDDDDDSESDDGDDDDGGDGGDGNDDGGDGGDGNDDDGDDDDDGDHDDYDYDGDDDDDGDDDRCIHFYEELQEVIEDMDLIKKEVSEMFREKGAVKPQLQRNVSSAVMVGFDDVLHQLLDMLTGGRPSRQIIPIVGMGGIGKTTLARNAFEHPFIKEHFDIRMFATISQDSNVDKTLLDMISQGRVGSSSKNGNDLKEALYKYLYGRRYLIMLDDMWSIDLWDKLKFSFPDDNKGSRILVTTRLLNLAVNLANSSSIIKMSFLDEVNCWNLFTEIVFGKERFPLELVDVGKKIVEKCDGLPLAIVVIGGLMARSQLTQEYWEQVEKNLSSIVNSENGEYCLNILKISYNHLPAYLKPCFLHVGMSKEGLAIRVSNLIKLWVSEGFLKPVNNKSLETIAKEYLQELVDRNLILVDELGSLGKMKYLRIHDLLRDLCLKEAEKQRFYYVLNQNSCRGIESIDLPVGSLIKKLYSCYLGSSIKELSLLNDNVVAQLTNIRRWRRRPSPYEYFLEDVFELVNSRYLIYRSANQVPCSISLVWNLHTLIIWSSDDLSAPIDIWKMHQLEHVESTDGGLYVADPPSGENTIMENLQTLKGVKNFNLNEEVVKRIPNIKKLGIRITSEGANCLSNLHCLRKLESFCCSIEDGSGDEYFQKISFPGSLIKLTLDVSESFRLEEILEKIASLPLLEKLDVRGGQFITRNWETVEGQFSSLKFLSLLSCESLERWTLEGSVLPRLEQLHLSKIKSLKEIPSEVAEISTLGSVLLVACSESMATSLKKIVDEHEELYGQPPFNVQIMAIDLEAMAMAASLSSVCTLM